MRCSISLKLLICSIFLISAIIQCNRSKNIQVSHYHSKYNHLLNISTNQFPQIKQEFDLTLPLIDEKVSNQDIEWAINFLRLPKWSSGYQNCRDYENLPPEQKSSNNIYEVSCFEIYRAAKVIKNWEDNVEKGQTEGEIFVNSNIERFPTAEDFYNSMSMLYHGMQISLTFNRKLTTTISQYESGGFNLPTVIKNHVNDLHQSINLPSNWTFNSIDFDRIPPNVTMIIDGASWPQCLYTSHLIAPFLRSNFGYHAAYFLGNYLFGSLDKPKMKSSEPIEYGVEGFLFSKPGMSHPNTFYDKFPRCGFQSNQAVMITNDMTSNFLVNEKNVYKNIIKFDLANPDEMSKILYTLISSKQIVKTFGSVLGFWANAMQGRKGFYINAIDNICVNMTNSQQGSLIHTYVNPRNKTWMFYSCNYLYLYGKNIHDMELYMNYLLW